MPDIKLISQRAQELSDLINQMITETTAPDPELVVASQNLDDALQEFTGRIGRKL